MPVTEYEATGGITSLESQDAFFQQVVAETQAEMSMIGHSARGRAIYHVTIGNPSGVPIMLLAAVHGTEPAPRESSMMWVRDLAYSSQPDVLGFLSRFQVHLIITLNPDGIATGLRRNGNNVDLNRDWFSLTQPETQAAKQVITDVEPAMIIDLHEWGSSGFVFGYADADLVETPRHPSITNVFQDLLDDVIPELEDAGFPTRIYPNGLPAVAAQHQTSASVASHALGFLVETSARAEFPDRVESTLLFLQLAMSWLLENEQQLVAAQQDSITDAENGVQPNLIPSINSDGSPGPWEEVAIPDVYQIPASFQVPYDLMDIHGITLGSGQVSTHQKARGFIAVLFDERSYANIFDNPWTGGSNHDDVSEQPVLTVSAAGGMLYPAYSVHINKGGVMHAVSSLSTQNNGITLRLGQ